MCENKWSENNMIIYKYLKLSMKIMVLEIILNKKNLQL